MGRTVWHVDGMQGDRLDDEAKHFFSVGLRRRWRTLDLGQITRERSDTLAILGGEIDPMFTPRLLALLGDSLKLAKSLLPLSLEAPGDHAVVRIATPVSPLGAPRPACRL